MRKKVVRGSLFAVLTLLLPFLITCLLNKNKSDLDLKSLTYIPIYDSMEPEYPLNFDRYITGVILASIPADYELETLKAQAVIARTYALKNLMILKQKKTNNVLTDSVHPESLGYTTDELGLSYLSPSYFLAENSREKYRTYLTNVNSAVNATKGDIITYKNNLITPLYFSTSTGKTRDSKELWSVGIPYLKSVDSNQDVESSDYMKITLYTTDSLLQQLNYAYKNRLLGASEYDYQVYDSLPIDRDNFFDTAAIIKRDSAGYVLTMSLGGVLISGESFANVLSLNSSCFYLENYQDRIRIICNGTGHGIGFSQYGANILAKKEGYDYKELLKYYFTDIQIDSMQ